MWIRPLLTLAVVATALALTASAAADRGDDRTELRIRGACTGQSVWSLRIEAEEGTLRIEFRIDSPRRARRWTLVLLRERRIVFRGVPASAGGSRSVRLRRSLTDWPGEELVAVRAAAADGEACRASGVV
jgi:hypothetical protein